MRQGARALVEVTGWLAQHVDKFFALCPASHEFGGDETKGIPSRLELLDADALDPRFVEAGAYDLRLFQSVITTRPRELLAPDTDIEEQEIQYTFAIWTQRRPSDSISFIGASSVLDSNVKRMWRDIFPDLHALGAPTGVARKRLARLAGELEKRIPGRSFLHIATVESATHPQQDDARDLVSVFVDLATLERSAGLLRDVPR